MGGTCICVANELANFVSKGTIYVKPSNFIL